MLRRLQKTQVPDERWGVQMILGPLGVQGGTQLVAFAGIRLSPVALLAQA